MTLLRISTVLPPQRTFVPSVPLRFTMCNRPNLCATTLPLHTLLEPGQTLSNHLPVPLTVSKSVSLPSLLLSFPFSTHIRAVVNVVVSTSHTVHPLVQTVSQTVLQYSPLTEEMALEAMRKVAVA